MRWIIVIALVVFCVAYFGWNRFDVTAYCEGELTKSGTPVREGVVAVDPKEVRLGSMVYIWGMGWYKAEDVGGKVKGKVIDIYMKDCQDAKKFGRQRLNVFIY